MRAFDLLLRHSDRLRGYLLLRFERFLQGPVGVEVVVIDGILRCLKRAVEFAPSDPGALEFWFFRQGVGIAQQTMSVRADELAGTEPSGGASLEEAIAGLPEPMRTIARTDHRFGGRAPLSALALEVDGDEQVLLRRRAEARARLQPVRGRLVNARTHQSWYQAVARCGVGPDVHSLTEVEAWEEFRHAPREGIGRLEQVFRTEVDRSGLTTALVSALRQGSSEALQRLILRYQPRMREIVLRLMGPRKGSAEDVLQEVNLKLVRDGLSNFVPRGRGFLVRYLHVVLRNEIRLRGRRRPNYTMLLPEELEDLAAQEDPDATGKALERLPVWLDRLESINPRWAEVIRLRRDRLSYREIAARLGTSESAVSQRVHRAMSALSTLALSDRETVE